MSKTKEPAEKKLISTFEEACEKMGLPTDGSFLPNVSAFPEKHRHAITAAAKLIIIAEALNDGWEPNWTIITNTNTSPGSTWISPASGSSVRIAISRMRARPAAPGFASVRGSWLSMQVKPSLSCTVI